MTKILLQVDGLKKIFLHKNGDIKLFNNVNLKVKKGDLIALVGPSGSGKSSFLHLLALLDEPSQVKIFLNNQDSKSAIINYVDQDNKVSMRYPFNPNGSLNGSNGFTNSDGRVTILMPHPERLYEISQYSYVSSDWQISPWTKFFINAREWLK